MNVSESKFRQILREEARRVLREVGDTTPSPEPAGGTGATPPNAKEASWSAIDTALGQLVVATGADPELAAGPRQIIIKAKAGWAACKTSASPKSTEVYNSFSTYRDQGLGTQLAGALLLLSDTPPAPPIGTFTFGLKSTDATAMIKILNDTGKTLVPKLVAHLTPALPTAAPAAGTPTDMSNDLVYTVKAGDSLSKILRTYYGIPATSASMPLYTAFAEIIDIKNMNAINIGQRITLPNPLIIGAQTFARKLNT